jgi:hypothetical protein
VTTSSPRITWRLAIAGCSVVAVTACGAATGAGDPPDTESDLGYRLPPTTALQDRSPDSAAEAALDGG